MYNKLNLKIMKTTKIILSVFFFLLIANLGLAQTQSVANFKVNSTCNSCKMKIEGALNSTTGVSSSVLDLNTKIVTVNYDNTKVTENALANVISDKGYIVEKVAGVQKCCNGQTNANCKGKTNENCDDNKGKTNGRNNKGKTNGNCDDRNNKGKTNGNDEDNSKGKTNNN